MCDHVSGNPLASQDGAEPALQRVKARQEAWLFYGSGVGARYSGGIWFFWEEAGTSEEREEREEYPRKNGGPVTTLAGQCGSRRVGTGVTCLLVRCSRAYPLYMIRGIWSFLHLALGALIYRRCTLEWLGSL